MCFTSKFRDEAFDGYHRTNKPLRGGPSRFLFLSEIGGASLIIVD